MIVLKATNTYEKFDNIVVASGCSLEGEDLWDLLLTVSHYASDVCRLIAADNKNRRHLERLAREIDADFSYTPPDWANFGKSAGWRASRDVFRLVGGRSDTLYICVLECNADGKPFKHGANRGVMHSVDLCTSLDTETPMMLLGTEC